MDIRKTRILHKRYTLSEWQSLTLRQGEFGFLLSDDKTLILEVRVGTHDIFQDNRIVGVSWSDAVIVASLSGTDDKVTIEQLNQVVSSVELLSTQVALHSTILNTFEDTDTRVVISEGVGEGTIHVDYWSKNDVVTPGHDIKIPGWDNLVNIALGRTKSHVYSNPLDSRFLADIVTPGKFHVGDIIYFESTDVPDRWVTAVHEYPVDGSLYSFSTLKVEAPVLTDYLKVAEAAATYVTKDTLNNLNVEQVGGDGYYIESIKQQGGRVVSVSKQLPDIDNIVLISANKVTTEIKAHIDERIGATDTDENGAAVSVVKHVLSRVTKLSDDIQIVKSSVSSNTNLIAVVTQSQQEMQGLMAAIVQTSNNLASRVTRLELISGAGGGTGVISIVKVGGTPLNIDSSDNSVNISEISTDLLVKGSKNLIFDCQEEIE